MNIFILFWLVFCNMENGRTNHRREQFLLLVFQKYYTKTLIRFIFYIYLLYLWFDYVSNDVGGLECGGSRRMMGEKGIWWRRRKVGEWMGVEGEWMLALVFGLHSSGSLWRKERGIEDGEDGWNRARICGKWIWDWKEWVKRLWSWLLRWNE